MDYDKHRSNEPTFVLNCSGTQFNEKPNKETRIKVPIPLVMILIIIQVSENLSDRDISRLPNGVILRHEGNGYLISGIYNGILVVDLPEVKLPRTVQIYCKLETVGRSGRPARVHLNDSLSGERNETIEGERDVSAISNTSKPIKTWDQMELEMKNGSSEGCYSLL